MTHKVFTLSLSICKFLGNLTIWKHRNSLALLSLDWKEYFDRTTSGVQLTSACFVDWFSIRGTISVCFTFFCCIFRFTSYHCIYWWGEGYLSCRAIGKLLNAFCSLAWVPNALIPWLATEKTFDHTLHFTE